MLFGGTLELHHQPLVPLAALGGLRVIAKLKPQSNLQSVIFCSSSVSLCFYVIFKLRFLLFSL